MLATSESAAAPPPERRATLPDQTRLTWSLTLTRAIVVMAVLISHWGPGLLNQLGLPQTLFISFTRLGTPGFAMVFGIGVGLYMLPEMARNAKAVYHRVDRAAFLVGVGAVLMGVAYLVYAERRGSLMNWLTVSNAFYSVLVYYVIMLASARLWLPALARLRAPVTSLLILSLVLWAAWQLMRDILPGEQYVSPIELARLMFGAGGYNVFKLGAMTAAGIAVGYWIKQQTDLGLVCHRMLMIGGLGAVFCGAALLQAHGTILLMQSTSMHTSLIGLGYYGSLCVLILGIFLSLVPAWARTPRRAADIASTCPELRRAGPAHLCSAPVRDPRIQDTGDTWTTVCLFSLAADGRVLGHHVLYGTPGLSDVRGLTHFAITQFRAQSRFECPGITFTRHAADPGPRATGRRILYRGIEAIRRAGPV